MFATDDDAEIPYPFPGERRWAYVTRTIHAPWIHVVVRGASEAEGYGYRQMAFLETIPQLLRLSELDDLKIIAVDLVSPPYMNGTPRWQMEPLREIWMGGEPGEPKEAPIFLLESGARYGYSRLRTPLEKLQNERLIYQAPVLQG